MGTAWIVITAAHLNDYSAGAKVNALRTAALAGGQADPFTNVSADVIARVRAQIGSNKTNQLSATANSVPPDLKTHTCWLIIQAMQGRLPGLKLTDDEKEMVKKAEDYLAKWQRESSWCSRQLIRKGLHHSRWERRLKW
jgi:hypothetical protein